MSSAKSRSRPGWFLPALRCGLEMALVLLIAGFVALRLRDPVHVGVVAVTGFVGAVLVFFWALNEQVKAWIRYASGGGRRRRRGGN